MLFPTTIAGSLPKPEWLAEPNTLWAPWKSKGDELARAKRDATMLAVKLQEDAGIDIVTEGEQARQHFVHGFLEKIEGIDFAHKVEMGIRKDRYKAMVPQVVAPLRLKGRVHADEARVARTHTTRKLKFTLPGPMTIIDTIADQYYGDRVKMAFAFAELLNEEAKALQADGVDVDPVRRARLQRLHGRGQRLGHQGAGARRRRPDLRHRRAHLLRLRHQGQYRLEANAGQRVAAVRGYLSGDRQKPDPAGRDRVPQFARCRWNCSALLKGKIVQAGVIDVASDTVETAEDVAKVIERCLEIRAEEQHRRDHQLRHGADASRYRGSQADGARRRREAGAAAVGVMICGLCADACRCCRACDRRRRQAMARTARHAQRRRQRHDRPAIRAHAAGRSSGWSCGSDERRREGRPLR